MGYDTEDTSTSDTKHVITQGVRAQLSRALLKSCRVHLAHMAAYSGARAHRRRGVAYFTQHQRSFSHGQRLWLSALRVAAAPRLIGSRCPFQLANHESHNRHVLAFWNNPLQSLILQRVWVHSYAAIPTIAAAQRAHGDLERSRTHTHLEDQLYPMVKCELQAGAVHRVRQEPQACRGIESTSRSCTWPK